MVLQFYYVNASPPSRAVYMTLKALGVKFEIKTVDLFAGEQNGEEFKKINPRGKVPALVDGSLCISESRAISQYLCNKYASGSNKSLYPTPPDRRAVVDMLLYSGEWALDQVVAYLNIAGVVNKDEKPKYEKLDEVKSALQYHEDRLKKSKFLAGDQLTIADLFAMVTVTFLQIGDFGDLDAYPSVKKWMTHMTSLPYYDECNKEGLKVLKDFYTPKLKAKISEQTQF